MTRTSAMLVPHLLSDAAARTPDAPAVIEPSRQITYRELDRLANKTAHLLRGAGVSRGDRVLLALDNCIELVAAYFGTMRTGAIAVPLPPGPRSDRLASALADCTPSACITDLGTATDTIAHAGFGSVRALFVLGGARDQRGTTFDGRPLVDLRQALDEIGTVNDPSEDQAIDLDLATIIYTSGSTGAPRGVMLRHRNILANTASIVSYLNLTSADRVMCVLPFYYVYGLSLLHTHIAVGGSIVMDNRFAYPNVVLEAMQKHGVTGLAGVPSTFAILLHRSSIGDMSFPDLRYVTQAGGGMPPARVREWLERGPKVPFFVMYGATEASARLTYLPPSELERKLGSIGRPIPNVEIVVVTDSGRVARTGEVGELVARGANIACGYWNNPEETAEKFDDLGYRTGDLGYVDDEGYLFLVGRRHDMIKVGAHRVGAKEIEDLLSMHPAVLEAAVIAVPHDILGEAPIAYVSLKGAASATPDEIHTFCKARLASHKVPISVHLIPELPKLSATGKIDRQSLRSMAHAPQPGFSTPHAS